MTSLRTHWTYWVVALAAHKLGLILSPVYYRLTQKDFVYRTQKAAARCIVTCQESRETLLAVAEETGVRLRFSIGGGEGFEDLLAAIAPNPPPWTGWRPVDDPPALLHLRHHGRAQRRAPQPRLSPGKPLGARYMQDTHEGSLHFATGDTGWEVVSGTKFYGQWLHLGALLVYDYDRFPPEKVLACLEEVRATGMMAQPTVYRMLTEVGMDKYDLSSITNYAVGGEKALPGPGPEGEGADRPCALRRLCPVRGQPDRRRLQEAGLEGGLGGEDPSQIPCGDFGGGRFLRPARPAGGDRHCGRPRPPPEGLMMGYLQDEEATRRLWDGRLFHTGDTATRDEEGFLFFLGRSDGMIKTKGYRVSPVEIEEALSLHPAVYECLATGEPDQNLGQRIKVYVVPAPGHSPSQALAEELITFHNSRCAGFQKDPGAGLCGFPGPQHQREADPGAVPE